MSQNYPKRRFTKEKFIPRLRRRFVSLKLHPKTLPFCFVAGTVVVSLCGALPLLLIAIVGSVTVASLLTKQSTDRLLNQLAAFIGGWNVLFLALAAAFGISLLLHGHPAHAVFDGAKDAANTGIGRHIGEDEATSMIDTIIFAMWAFVAVGGIATIAGGVIQNVMVLVGGLTLFFGVAVLIGVLEFADGLLFTT